MALKIIGSGSTELEIDANKAARISTFPRKVVGAYKVSSITGTIGAALGANSAVFAARLDPSAGLNAILTSLRLQWTTIVAFGTPVTAGRRLALYRGSGAAASSGTGLAVMAEALTDHPNSQMNSGEGGDVRIATTGALTVTGITFEAQEFETLHLTGFGAAGATKELKWSYDTARAWPPYLKPGELWAIRNPVAMDSTGTWQLAIDLEWIEVVAAQDFA